MRESLDPLAIMTHHDAITGTAKQRVADDYAYKLYKARKANRETWTSQFKHFIRGFESEKYEWCERTNGTYLDCPIAEKTTQNFAVVVYNPTYDQRYMKLKVAHGNYDVYAYEPHLKKNVPVDAEVICLERALENGTVIHDCDMHIDVTTSWKIANYKFTVIILEYNPGTDLELPELADGIVQIESKNERYTYFGTSKNGLVF